MQETGPNVSELVIQVNLFNYGLKMTFLTSEKMYVALFGKEQFLPLVEQSNIFSNPENFE